MIHSRLFRPSSQNPLDLDLVEMFSQAISQTSSPRLLDSPCTRLLLYQLSLITSIAVSTLVTGTLTRTLLLSSTLSSRNTTESCHLPPTPLTWTQAKSREMLPAMFQFTPAVSEP